MCVCHLPADVSGGLLGVMAIRGSAGTFGASVTWTAGDACGSDALSVWRGTGLAVVFSITLGSEKPVGSKEFRYVT